MKQVSVVSTVILAVAVLVAAYAVGLLVRQARMETPETEQVASEPNDVNTPDAIAASRRIGERREASTPEEKAKAKEERAEKLAEVSELTDEERQARRDAMREQLGSRGQGGPGQIPRLSPEELAKVKNMSEEERRAFRAKMRPRGRARPSQAAAIGDPNGAAAASEPNATDPN